MNPEEIKGVIETIKTLNINFNDATTQKIAEAILPVFKWYIFLKIMEDLLILFTICLLFFTAFKLIKTAIDYDREYKMKKLENNLD